MAIFDELSTALARILPIIPSKLSLPVLCMDGVHGMLSWPYDLATAYLTGSVVVPPKILLLLVGGVHVSIQKRL